jgi:Cu(I)/Ag(I) efflux system membrane fusion protein
LTLTVVNAAKTTLQTWVRTAGTLDESGGRLTACVRGPDAALIQPGQRVRAFPPDSKSSMYQARVSRVEAREGCILVEATLSGPTYEQAPRYVIEVIVERGEFLAIPNEAIIEEGDKQIVYLQQMPGHYVPQEIHTGLKGELYAEVLNGLSEGDQVVTFGSFFIDAEYKLKNADPDAMSNAHQHH